MTPTAFECKLCRAGTVNRSYVLERPWKGRGRYLVVECGGCGLVQNLYDWRHAVEVQQAERHNILERRRDELWDSHAELDANEEKAREFSSDLDALRLVRDRKILEVGCGKGLFLRACQDLGAAAVTGQDFFNKRPLDFARDELGIADLRTVGFEDRGAWPDGEFDVVCSFDVVEHVHDLADFFEQCLRVLRPGGVLYHATPGSDSVSNRVGRALVGHFGSVTKLRTTGTSLVNLQDDDNFRGGAHVSLLGRDQVDWIARQYGLTTLKAEYVSSYTYSNRHYAALIPGLRKLPPAVGASVFAGVRRVVRNKLVFAARAATRPAPPVPAVPADAKPVDAPATLGSRPAATPR